MSSSVLKEFFKSESLLDFYENVLTGQMEMSLFRFSSKSKKVAVVKRTLFSIVVYGK